MQSACFCIKPIQSACFCIKPKSLAWLSDCVSGGGEAAGGGGGAASGPVAGSWRWRGGVWL